MKRKFPIWPYSGDVGNPKYEKDRAELFAKNGNGWFIFQRWELKKQKPDVVETHKILW